MYFSQISALYIVVEEIPPHNFRLGDAEANLVAELHYDHLCQSLRRRVPTRYVDLADQAAGEAVMEHIQRPDRWTGRGTLWAYLLAAGSRNLGRLAGRARSFDVIHVSLDDNLDVPDAYAD